MMQACGCYYHIASAYSYEPAAKHYLPQVKINFSTTIHSTASRTILTQKFFNPTSEKIGECVYAFPLYEGVSVVGFTCRIGSRVLRGLVKEKSKARKSYNDAVARGETAGLLEQLPEASDVFSTKLGNIPTGETVHVELTYVGELKYDAEANGIRFTIPMIIAPRYGSQPRSSVKLDSVGAQEQGGMEVTVDVNMPEGSLIQGVQSPSHPIAVTLGKISSSPGSVPGVHRASATLSSARTELDQDFILILQISDHNAPKALLETHLTIPNQRALMVTLVPQFSLPPSHPEIVFVVDRSGSMQSNIPTLVSALQVFLKSLPVGVKFNICSFGSYHSFLWGQSKAYSHDSLQEATAHVRGFAANFGGTETFAALKATIENRYVDLPCELILLTDGQIWNQVELFSYLNKEVKASKAGIRVFTLGIGSSVSHALVEGIARAGNGFAQTVGENEKFDKKVVRMLKGALSPHLKNCEMEVKYETSEDNDDGFEIVEKVMNSLRVLSTRETTAPGQESVQKKPISFYEEAPSSDTIEIPPSAQNADANPYAHLPQILPPKLLQTPSVLPSLFPFSRTVVYILLGENSVQQTPKSITLRASSSQGPLELTIPVEEIQEPGETIHQLAARKTIQEFEEGRGWIFDRTDETGALLRDKYPGQFEEMIEREGVRLGVQFQVSGKWLAFVAVAENDQIPGQEQGVARLDRTFGHESFVQDENRRSYSPQSSSATAQGGLFHGTVASGSREGGLFGATASRGLSTPFGGSSPSPGGSIFGDSGPPWRQLTSTRSVPTDDIRYGGSSRSREGGSFGAPSVPTAFKSFGGPSASFRGPIYGGNAASASSGGALWSAPSASAGGALLATTPQPPPLAPSIVGLGGPPSSTIVSPSFFCSTRRALPATGTYTSPPKKAKMTSLNYCLAEPSKSDDTMLTTSPSDRILYSLIDLQNFAGFWEADKVTDVIGISWEKLWAVVGPAKIGAAVGPGAGVGAEYRKFLITLLVVRYLELYMPEEKDVWELVVDKARAWLAERGGLGDDGMEGEVDGVLKTVKG